MNLIEELEKKKTIALNFPTNTEVVKFSDFQIKLFSAREELEKRSFCNSGYHTTTELETCHDKCVSVKDINSVLGDGK